MPVWWVFALLHSLLLFWPHIIWVQLGKAGMGVTTLSPDAQDLPSLDSWASGDKARRRPRLELVPACPPATSLPPALAPVPVTGADH